MERPCVRRQPPWRAPAGGGNISFVGKSFRSWVRRARGLLTALALVASALLGAGNGRDVLCIGADGHVAVESVAGRCCEDAPAPAEPDGCPGPGEDGSDAVGSACESCCACLDLPLPSGAEPRLVRGDSGKAKHVVFAPFAIAPALAAPVHLAGALPPAARPPGGSPLDRLATVFLRC